MLESGRRLRLFSGRGLGMLSSSREVMVFSFDRGLRVLLKSRVRVSLTSREVRMFPSRREVVGVVTISTQQDPEWEDAPS